jgi:hypothetical protein
MKQREIWKRVQADHTAVLVEQIREDGAVRYVVTVREKHGEPQVTATGWINPQ